MDLDIIGTQTATGIVGFLNASWEEQSIWLLNFKLSTKNGERRGQRGETEGRAGGDLKRPHRVYITEDRSAIQSMGML